jgi:phage-related baseplate assembly protein
MSLFGFDPSIVPDIEFCQKDASLIEAQVITNHERMFAAITKVAKTLGRADPVRLFLLTNIYQLVVQRSIVDSTGKQNLLKYAKGSNLDNVGAKWGNRGVRLTAKPARTTLRFILSSPLTIQVVVPAGTKAQSNSRIQFKSLNDAILPAGTIWTESPAEAVEPGSLANGLVPGQVNQLIEWNEPFFVGVTNLTTTAGGADREPDDHLRARIWMAPESFSVAGPYGAYEYWAASANPDIIDVGVWSDAAHAGQVYIHPLMVGGTIPSQEVLDQVYAICSADDIRPLTDQVFVEVPHPIVYEPTVRYWIKLSDRAFAPDIQQKVETAYDEYILWQRSAMGRDINPSECDKRLVAAGAKRTDIPESESPFKFQIVDAQSVGVESKKQLIYEGLEIE